MTTEVFQASVLVMDEVESLQGHFARTVIEAFDEEFVRLHKCSCELIETIPVDLLYGDAHADSDSASIGMLILRSSGVVEQFCGGITSNLWDDPFEWTLPESLSTTARVIEYLREVEETRKHAFACFAGDEDLLKMIATPSGEMRPLVSLILDTLVRAVRFQDRAVSLLPKRSQELVADRQTYS